MPSPSSFAGLENFRWVLESQLAVGGKPDEANDQALQALKRSGFVLVGKFNSNFQSKMQHYRIPFVSFFDLQDRMDEPFASRDLEPVLFSLKKILSSPKGKAYLCCAFGYTLSPTIALVFLTEVQKFSIEQAMRAIKPVRSIHEEEILKRYIEYFAKKQAHRHEPVPVGVRPVPPVVFWPKKDPPHFSSRRPVSLAPKRFLRRKK